MKCHFCKRRPSADGFTTCELCLRRAMGVEPEQQSLSWRNKLRLKRNAKKVARRHKRALAKATS